MDESDFDALARNVSATRTRRDLAQRLLGAAIGSLPLLPAFNAMEAKRNKNRKRLKPRGRRQREHGKHGNGLRHDGVQADKKGKKQPCPPCKKRKQGKCKGALPDGAACPGGSCQAGACVPAACTPDCAGKTCGDNGCGGSCGACTGNERCSGGSCCSGLQPAADLQAAIDVAPVGATIRLCAGTWELPSRLLPKRDLTLIGSGADRTILTGGDECVVQTLSGTIVTLQDLKVTGGNRIGVPGGAGIVNYAGSFFAPPQLTLIGVHVTDNLGAGIRNLNGASLLLKAGTVVSGNGPAGGISSYEGDVTLEDSRVENNTTDSLGGGISNTLGVVTLKAGSSVLDNSANPFHGGGIYTLLGTLILEHGSRVTGNTASFGGGIATDQSTVTLEAGSKVTGNIARASGGGGINCFSEDDVVTLETEDIVVDNHEVIAGEATISNCAPVNTIPNCIG